MIKSMYKKILIIFLLATIFIITISCKNQCFAISDVTEDLYWNTWEPQVEDDAEVLDKAGIILGVVRTVGIVVSVGSIAFIGIKIMVGSVEEKASYKQTMIPWIIGATMVFAITCIPSIIYEFTNGALIESGGVSSEGEKTAEYWEQYIEGYDDAVSESYSKFISTYPFNYTPTAQELSKITTAYEDELEKLKDKVQTHRAYYTGYQEGLKDMWSWDTAEMVKKGCDKAMKNTNKNNIYTKIYTVKKLVKEDYLKTSLITPKDNTAALDLFGYEAMLKRLEMTYNLYSAQTKESGGVMDQGQRPLKSYGTEWLLGYDMAIKTGYSAYSEANGSYVKLNMEAKYEEEFETIESKYVATAAILGYRAGMKDMLEVTNQKDFYTGYTEAIAEIEAGKAEEKYNEAKNKTQITVQEKAYYRRLYLWNMYVNQL